MVHFAKHNAIANYFNASGANQKDLAKLVIVDTLASLIYNRPSEVKITMRKSGIDIAQNAGYNEIIDKMVKQGANNSKFHKNMAILITEYSMSEKERGHYFNSIGNSARQGSTTLGKLLADKEIQSGVQGAVSGALKGSSEEKSEEIKKELKNILLDKEGIYNELKKKERRNKTKKTLTWIAIGSAVVVFGWFLIKTIQKAQAEKAAKMQEGGEIKEGEEASEEMDFDENGNPIENNGPAKGGVRPNEQNIENYENGDWD